jgi:outer membrane protein assembly factor BamB
MYQSRTSTDGERFFVGGWDNMFRCIHAESGNELWAKRLGRSARSDVFSAFAPAIVTPATGDGKVFISTNDGVLHALKISDGEELWRVDWKRMGYSSPLHVNGKVFAALSDEGKVFCVDADPKIQPATTQPTTGPSSAPIPVNIAELTWQGETGSVIYDSSFAYGAGQVYIGSVAGIVSAFDAATGQRVWQYRMGSGHLLGSPVADEERVYMGSMSGKVIALPAKPPAPAAASAK